MDPGATLSGVPGIDDPQITHTTDQGRDAKAVLVLVGSSGLSMAAPDAHCVEVLHRQPRICLEDLLQG
jgi:hypothetical protein